MRRNWRLFSSAALGLLLLACGLDPGQLGMASEAARPPSVSILAPPSGFAISEGQSLPIEISAWHSEPLRELRLVADGDLVATSGSPRGRTTLTTTMNWRPKAPGAHTIWVIAVDQEGRESPPAVVTVTVEPEAAAPEPTEASPPEEVPSSEEPAATTEPSQEPQEAPSVEEDCRDEMDFVADVTVPDGSEMKPGEVFEKVWRIENAGSCEWEGYRLAHDRGPGMAQITTTSIPSTNPGETADIGVEMTAPAEPGEHTARWVVQDFKGDRLGILTVAIVVEAEEGPAVRSDPGPAGAPVIDALEATPGEQEGCFQLSWALHGAKIAYLVTNPGTPAQGRQGVVGEESQMICPEGETVYRIEASNDEGVAWKEVVLP